jgi:N-acetylmuramoyl-L-alanine amidase
VPELPVEEEPTKPFHDLSSTHWGYEIMLEAIEQQIIQGYADGTVRPDAPISRAEVAAVFDRIWSNTSRRQVTISTVPAMFEDVPQDQWFTGSVYRLVRAKLIQGTGNNRFEPERSMSRAEAAVMFDRYQAIKQPS